MDSCQLSFQLCKISSFDRRSNGKVVVGQVCHRFRVRISFPHIIFCCLLLLIIVFNVGQIIRREHLESVFKMQFQQLLNDVPSILLLF